MAAALLTSGPYETHFFDPMFEISKRKKKNYNERLVLGAQTEIRRVNGKSSGAACYHGDVKKAEARLAPL